MCIRDSAYPEQKYQTLKKLNKGTSTTNVGVKLGDVDDEPEEEVEQATKVTEVIPQRPSLIIPQHIKKDRRPSVVPEEESEEEAEAVSLDIPSKKEDDEEEKI
eukprot:TRINITY_DN1603_c0_g2_i2.p1 TRINITY_DN1603_c0_g2~~TRINITY_DN1603_c0_g2_i2.p1  ORF type:complete len:118 (+),score=32.20 TRINITY_DN1603_c0_g2_i2:47-355(+)